MIKAVKREKFPIKSNIHDSNWNCGIMIGNIIIFNSRKRKETKKIKTIFQHDNDTHGFYVEFKGDDVLRIIYLQRD